MIPRCGHSVYSPDGDGRPSEYCSGCYTILPLLTARLTTDAAFEDRTIHGGGFVSPSGFVLNYQRPIAEFFDDEEEEAEPAECPACFAPMKIEDEYDLECLTCGFNDL